MSIRTLVVCPGRGSYDRGSLGQLQDRGQAARVVIDACDAWRAEQGRPTVRELDADERFRTTRHVAGEHASLLTFACSLADLAELDRDAHDVVAVTGNSMGWYTALVAAGALSLRDAIRLVDTMGGYQAGNVVGGQVLYPTADTAWRPDPALRLAIDKALARCREAGHVAEWSIELGGFAVLGADAAGTKCLLERLKPVERASRTFPMQLPLHSAFHTSLMRVTQQRAWVELGDLTFRPPHTAVVDGSGIVHRPWSASPDALRAYTLDHQVVQTYDFVTAVRAALRYSGAERVVALGPGNALGGPLARILAQEGWRGASGRKRFEAMQATESPSLLSFGVAPQRRRLV